MGFSFTSATHPRHSSRTLFTAHASRTHVKAPQTDLHVKPDNSSGSTHDSPSEKPLRTKTTFQPKTAPKKHRRHQAVRGPPKPSTSQLSSMPIQSENRDQGPKGSIESQARIHLDARSHSRSPESIRSDSVAQCHWHRSHRGSATIGLGSRSLGIGIGSPPEHRGRASASYFYRVVYKCRLQGVISGIGSGFDSNPFWLPLKFISVSTQIHLGFYTNGFERHVKWGRDG